MAEHEFKKGDRVVFVKDDYFGDVEMPEGTLATYDDDNPTTGVPRVKLDTGERAITFRPSIAHAEDHGTGDGSASDICAEPGCNCDLERRFPAPLDPAAVKPGDPVTVRVEHPGRPALTVAGAAHAQPGAGVYLGGWRVDDLPDYVTLIAHPPAPEPEPEWKPGDTVTEEVHILDATELQPGDVFVGPDLFDGYIVRRAQPAPEPEPEWLFEFKGEEGPEGDEHWVRRFPSRADALRSMIESASLDELNDFEGPVSFSVYTDETGPVSERLVVIDPADVDEPRPLPTEAELAEAMYGVVTGSRNTAADYAASVHAHLARNSTLRGESR